MKTIIGYKVRHSKTKLYLSSVSRMRWTKVGKTWSRKGDLVRSINNGIKRRKTFFRTKEEYVDILDDITLWEIVELSEEKAYTALFLLDKVKP